MTTPSFIIGTSPSRQDLSLYRGDDVEIPFEFKEVNGLIKTALNITGYTFKMRIQQKRGATEVLTLSTAAGSIPLTDAANGKMKVVLTAAQTAAFSIDCDMEYDLQWTDAGGKKRTICTGKVTVTKDITT